MFISGNLLLIFSDWSYFGWLKLGKEKLWISRVYFIMCAWLSICKVIKTGCMFLLPWGNLYNGNQHFLEFISELLLLDTPPDLWSLAMSDVKISLSIQRCYFHICLISLINKKKTQSMPKMRDSNKISFLSNEMTYHLCIGCTHH